MSKIKIYIDLWPIITYFSYWLTNDLAHSLLKILHHWNLAYCHSSETSSVADDATCDPPWRHHWHSGQQKFYFVQMSLEAMPVHVKVIRKIFSLTNKCMMRTTINCRFLIKITLQFVPFFRARFHLFFFFYQVPNMHVFCSSGGEEAEAGRIRVG